jgi:hypothetical protein
MQFDPINLLVFTDEGEFIKQLNCPYKMSWERLEPKDSVFRKCGNCERLVMDTGLFSDNEIQTAVRENPDTCLKIDLNQGNVKLKMHGTPGNK